MTTIKFKIAPSQAGQRLDLVMTEAPAENGVTALTRSAAKALIEKNQVTVDGVVISKAGLIVRAGQEVTVEIPAPAKLDLTPRDVGIKILFEDENLAVLEKPAGISVHPSETEQGDTVVHGLLHSLKSLSSVGGVERPGIVHRIDKGTSGVLVVSKTDQAHLSLSAQFKAHTIDRRYRALVYGDLSVKGSQGRVETFFGRHPTHRKKMTGRLTSGRKAITHWKVLERFIFGSLAKDGRGPALTLVECRLETGRTHQIRAHLSEMGFPVVGDPLYGDHERKARALREIKRALGDALLELSHQLLHAYHLKFEHPTTGAPVENSSPLPHDFEKIVSLARDNATR